MEWYRWILNNPSDGQVKKSLQHPPSSTRDELLSVVASIPRESMSTNTVALLADYRSLTTPTSVTHALRNDTVSPISKPGGQSRIIGAPFSDPFIAQAYVEVIMAKRSRDSRVGPENTSQAGKRQKLLPPDHADLNDSASLSTSPESAVESDFESFSDVRRHPPHGNCNDKKWNDLFNGLAAFKEEHGHCRVPQHYKPNIYLSQWVKRQRYYRKHRPGLISERRVQKLDQLGFVWDAQEDFWNTRFEDLKTYKLMHGHCNVPCKYPANQKLATWVKCQRRQYKLGTLGKPSSMTDERIKLLEKLGFAWKIRGPDVGSQSEG
eukprot:scaffold6927_cov93-Cylindrotheca_fusiformis.AAC.10